MKVQDNYIFDKENNKLYFCFKQELNKSVGVILLLKQVSPESSKHFVLGLDHFKYHLDNGKYILSNNPYSLKTLYAK